MLERIILREVVPAKADEDQKKQYNEPIASPIFLLDVLFVAFYIWFHKWVSGECIGVYNQNAWSLWRSHYRMKKASACHPTRIIIIIYPREYLHMTYCINEISFVY